MGSRRLGRRRLRAIDGRKEQPGHDWANKRVPALALAGLTPGIQSVQLGQMHGYGIEDLADVAAHDATTGIWVRDDADSGAIALVANDADFLDGAFSITTGASAAHQTGVATLSKPFQCTTGKPWWIETLIKVVDISATEFFFGLSEAAVDADSPHTTAPAGGLDLIGFSKAAHDSNAVTLACSSNGSAAGTIIQAPTSAITLAADNNVLGLAVHWDGKGNLEYYNSAVTATATPATVGNWSLNTVISSGIPTDSKLGLTLVVETGTATTESLIANYIRGAWTV
jgi:hypothetical protein